MNNFENLGEMDILLEKNLNAKGGVRRNRKPE
jgi:hypothetical protein